MSETVFFSTFAVVALVGAPLLVVLSYPIHLAYALGRRRHFADAGRRGGSTESAPAPRTMGVIVPLCGEEPGLVENLASIACQSATGEISIAFVAERADDPALAIARLTTDARVRTVVAGDAADDLGKVHNLEAGLAVVRAEILVFVDSDARLPDPDFLARVAAAFEDPGVGLVTCVPSYRDARDPGAALVAAMVNTDVAGLFAIQAAWNRLRLANGTCLAVRADVLEQIGGLASLRRRLLMDSALARLVSRHGWRVALHGEPVPVPCERLSLAECGSQAHRWHVAMRFGLPLTHYLGFGWLRSGELIGVASFAVVPVPIAVAVLVAAIGGRIASAALARRALRDHSPAWLPLLAPLADAYATFAWASAFLSPTVRWRGARYRVGRGATVELANPAGRRATPAAPASGALGSSMDRVS